MTYGAGSSFANHSGWIQPHIPYTRTEKNGQVVYEVYTNSTIDQWLSETFPDDKRIMKQHQLKGVWTDVPEDVYMLLKLKFA